MTDHPAYNGFGDHAIRPPAQGAAAEPTRWELSMEDGIPHMAAVPSTADTDRADRGFVRFSDYAALRQSLASAEAREPCPHGVRYGGRQVVDDLCNDPNLPPVTPEQVADMARMVDEHVMEVFSTRWSKEDFYVANQHNDPTRLPPTMDALCAECGRRYGQHFGDHCDPVWPTPTTRLFRRTPEGAHE